MSRKAKLIPRKMLSGDERLVLESRPSAWLYMKAASVSLFIAIVAALAYVWRWIPGAPEIPYYTEAMEGEYGVLLSWAILGMIAVAVLFFIARWLRWSSTVYAVTDERIITQRGIVNKTYEDIPLTMITNIDLSQSLGKRILGYGTMVFSTGGLGAGRKGDLVWEAVPEPISVRRKIQEVMDIRAKPKG